MEHYIFAFGMLLLGIAIGFLICGLIIRTRRVGTLRIDKSDPDDGSYFFLEVTNLKRIKNRRLITMRVNEENYISQK